MLPLPPCIRDFGSIPSTGETDGSLQGKGVGPVYFKEGPQDERCRAYQEKAYTGPRLLDSTRLREVAPTTAQAPSTLNLPWEKFFRSIILPLDQGGFPITRVKKGVGEPGPRSTKGLPTINQSSTLKYEGGEVLQ